MRARRTIAASALYATNPRTDVASVVPEATTQPEVAMQSESAPPRHKPYDVEEYDDEDFEILSRLDAEQGEEKEPEAPSYTTMNLDGISMLDDNEDEEGTGSEDDLVSGSNDEYASEEVEEDVDMAEASPTINETTDADPVQQGQSAAEDQGPKDSLPGLYPNDPIFEPKIYLKDSKTEQRKPVCDFHLAVMVFMTACDLSLQQYKAFREVMAFATAESIASLPESLITLKDRVRNHLPLMKIRMHDDPVGLTKLPPKSASPQNSYRLEIEEFVKVWLTLPKMVSNMHFGMGVIPKSIRRKEFWHGDAWMGSTRSTSGEFGRLYDGSVLLPSDCVIYKVPETGAENILRVDGVGRLDSHTGPISFYGKRLIRPEHLPELWKRNWADLREENKPSTGFVFPKVAGGLSELVLMDEDRVILPVTSIIGRAYVHFLDINKKPEELLSSLLPKTPTYFVKYIAYLCNVGPEGGSERPACRSVDKRHRIPAEQELLVLGRKRILETFVQGPGQGRRFSIPFTLFLDAFGLYRNSFHSIHGLYIQPACLDSESRLVNRE